MANNYNAFGRTVRRTKNSLIDFISTKGKQNLIVIGALIALIAIFCVLNPNFVKTSNIVSMTQKLAPYAIMALGVTFVIATGGIDLSIGTVCIASAVLAGKLFKTGLLPLWATIPVMIVIGSFFGLINGLLIAKLKLPAFIATLGTMMLSRGLSALIVNSPTVDYPSGTWFNVVFSNIKGTRLNEWLNVKEIPVGLFWIIGLALICMYLMYKCKIGRYILSIGSNEEATRLSGINVDKYKIIAYTISGLAAGVAAIFWAASFPTIEPATGNGFELDSIAGVYIGGTSAAGGVASIAGSVIGNIMLVVIRSGLTLVLPRFGINLNSEFMTFVLTGVIVVVAVLADVLKNKSASKVKIETEKERAKRIRKQDLADKEDEIDSILADKSLSKEEKIARVSAIEDEIAKI